MQNYSSARTDAAVEGRELCAIRDGMEVIVPPAALELLSWKISAFAWPIITGTQALLEGWAWDDAWRKLFERNARALRVIEDDLARIAMT